MPPLPSSINSFSRPTAIPPSFHLYSDTTGDIPKQRYHPLLETSLSNYVYVSREQVFILFFTIFLVVALLFAVAASIDPTCTKYTFLSRTLNLPPPSSSDYTACTPPFFDILFRFTARVISGPAMKAFVKGSTTPRSGLIFKKGWYRGMGQKFNRSAAAD